MCSIFGYYKIKKKEINERFVDNAFNFMRHRGPDNENFLNIDAKVGFGHQRLVIIDTSDKANQPMQTNSSYISFNGEIYNYIELKNELKKNNVNFITRSDTEVLLKGLEVEGIQFLNKCNGMFAFAFYNKEIKELILGRDRFGVKPLHYMIQEDVLYFSSEIKPLIKIKNKLEKNLKIYNSFLWDMATDFDEATFIKDIYQLKKGHYLVCSDSNIKIKQWYFNNDYNFDEKIFENENETLDFTETLLSDAIDKRLRSDVPVCITLSGGLDSTTIYTLTKERLKKDITPFTFRHPGSNTDEYEKVINLTAPYNDNVYCIQSDYEQGHKQIEETLYYLEFPIWNLSAVAYMDVYKGIRDRGFKVVLEGHGSDEQLGGYPAIVRSAAFEYLMNLRLKKAFEIYKVLNETNNPYLEQRNSFLRFFGSFVKKIIFEKRLDTSFDHAIQDIFDYSILPTTLRAFDRLTMRSSVESRSPFMDYRIVELFKKMPIKYKVSELGSKTILRLILKKYNKDYIYKDKRKMGFAYNLPAFFRLKENRDYMKEQISKFSMPEYGKFKRKALLSLAENYIGWKDTVLIWKIASLSIINKMYSI
jgi:asparagine synthase (glutamine-hydrolysing)